MHNLKRIFVAASVLLVLGAFAAFANGQGESGSFSGTVKSVTPTDNGNSATVVFDTTNGSYTVTIDQSIAAAAGLQVGKTITLKGVAHKLADGSESVDATDLEVDGENYQVAQSGTSSDSSNNQGEAEKPDHHPEQSSKDSETPDTGSQS